jgi:predicted regulator of Ras-like GTPase activity (Roadblock/LC7/MglB family)
MFGIFKNIFSKLRARQPVGEPLVAEPSEPIVEPIASPALSASLPPDLAPAAEPESVPAPARADALNLPVKLVVPRLPDSVRMKVNLVGAANASVAIPIATVLHQLPSGVVTISFDELRKACPAQIFSNVSASEQFTLELPLPEILSRVDPALLKRRPNQKRIEIPPSVTDVFGSMGEALPQSLADTAEEVEPTSSGAEPQLAPASPAGAGAAAGPVRLTPQSLAAKPVSAAPERKPVPVAPTPALPATPTRAGAVESDTFPIDIAAVSGAWPEAIRQDIALLNRPNPALEVPAKRVRDALQSGHVAFSWKEIRSWISPMAPGSPSPATAEVLLEFPLPIIAPLFLSRGKAPEAKRTFVPENIPDLFGGTGHATMAASVGKVQEPGFRAPVERATAPTPPAALELPAMAEEAPVNLGELFGQPDKQNWYPNEIVRKVVELPGVAGANISLHDGLPVASNWPPGVTNDTVCAFIAQIFGRVNHYTKELKLGDVQSLTFMMERGPLQIFKAGKLYFAVLGFHGKPLPTPQLMAIVTELTRQHR